MITMTMITRDTQKKIIKLFRNRSIEIKAEIVTNPLRLRLTKIKLNEN